MDLSGYFWENTNFHIFFFKNLLAVTESSASLLRCKSASFTKQSVHSPWRSPRESHESRLISLPDRRPSATLKSLQNRDCDLGHPVIVTLARWKRCHVGWRIISSSKATRRGMWVEEKIVWKSLRGMFSTIFYVQVVALVMENRVDYCCYWIGELLPR